ncbi:hypothetical protein GIB67_034042 [Kingdonia uniflora]|uniref:beta-galactosidase n=1 Tax=Kingdonia uniflora TaxID=39325 RepID=A0A7J7M655_9MAGN|nr:hypothetical protein GIB67_034042 [Kingdonia uniflora]
MKRVPRINFRTDNEPFKVAIKGFTTKIVHMMKAEGLFETQGGSIIMSQNELGPLENLYGNPGREYTKWAADLAVYFGTGVPWIMCKQDDTPNPIINTRNGFYCDYFSPNKIYKPKMWTEAWTDRFTAFGGTVPRRLVEDLAFSVARFIQKGGSFINYYMAHVFNYHAGGCAAFLMNSNSKYYATVNFRSMHYNLPPWSISILLDCKNTVFNTARVRSFFLSSLLCMFPPFYVEV